MQNIDTDKLKKFIKKYAEDDQEFRKSFLSEFGNIDIETHVDRFDSIINSTLKYSNIQDAMDGTKRVLKEADKNLKEENYDVVFAACKAVLTEWAPHVYAKLEKTSQYHKSSFLTHRAVIEKAIKDY